MMTKEDDLDALFAGAAAQPAIPSGALIERILADADALQPKPALVARARSPRGWFANLADWFGGGLSLAGMSAAALTGLFLGVSQPAQLVSLTELVTGTTQLDSLELLPSNGSLWAQE